jgi:hypothetical protein
MWRETCQGNIEVVNEKPSVRRASISVAGSCMGCTHKGLMKVNKLTSPTGTEIRLCDGCVKSMKNAS